MPLPEPPGPEVRAPLPYSPVGVSRCQPDLLYFPSLLPLLLGSSGWGLRGIPKSPD